MQTLEEAVVKIQASLADLHTKLDSLINKRPEIEPCPVCNSANKILTMDLRANKCSKICESCAIKQVSGDRHFGPSAPTSQEALAAWNKQSRELRGLKP